MVRLEPGARDEVEGGFTLIELLVVIIIIGMLAAIAIPVFLNQRQKGYDASARADLRNLANFEEIYLNDYGSYGPAAQLLASEPTMEVSAHDSMAIYYNGNIGYCLTATYQGDPKTWVYDSGQGGLQPQGATCPAANGGTLP